MVLYLLLKRYGVLRSMIVVLYVERTVWLNNTLTNGNNMCQTMSTRMSSIVKCTLGTAHQRTISK